MTISPAWTPFRENFGDVGVACAVGADDLHGGAERQQADGEVAAGLRHEEVAADGREVPKRRRRERVDDRPQEREPRVGAELGDRGRRADDGDAAFDLDAGEARTSQAHELGEVERLRVDDGHDRRAARDHPAAVAERSQSIVYRGRYVNCL